MNHEPEVTITSRDHGLRRGDVVVVNGQSFIVRSFSTGTITIGDVTRMDRIKIAASRLQRMAVNSFWSAYDAASDWAEDRQFCFWPEQERTRSR